MPQEVVRMTSAGRKSVSVRTEIAAAPDAVWAAVTDVTRMGEWSPECTGAAWRGTPAGPVLGARFRGRNRKGGIRWSTVCRVVEAEPGRAFAWDVSFGPIPVARWGFHGRRRSGREGQCRRRDQRGGGGRAPPKSPPRDRSRAVHRTRQSAGIPVQGARR
jgi:uncharacterized protein YndB with AHSA1/START domain